MPSLGLHRGRSLGVRSGLLFAVAWNKDLGPPGCTALKEAIHPERRLLFSSWITNTKAVDDSIHNARNPNLDIFVFLAVACNYTRCVSDPQKAVRRWEGKQYWLWRTVFIRLVEHVTQVVRHESFTRSQHISRRPALALVFELVPRQKDLPEYHAYSPCWRQHLGWRTWCFAALLTSSAPHLLLRRSDTPTSSQSSHLHFMENSVFYGQDLCGIVFTCHRNVTFHSPPGKSKVDSVIIATESLIPCRAGQGQLLLSLSIRFTNWYSAIVPPKLLGMSLDMPNPPRLHPFG